MRRGAVIAPLVDNTAPFNSHPFNELGVQSMRNGANFLSEMLMVPPLSMMASTLFGAQQLSNPLDGNNINQMCDLASRSINGDRGPCSIQLDSRGAYIMKEPRIQEIPDGDSTNQVDVPFDDTLEDSDSEIAEELEELKLSEIKASSTQ